MAFVTNRKRSKTELVKRLGLAGVKAKRDRVEAPNQHAWGLVGLHSHFCAGIEGQLFGFGLPWLLQSPVVLVVDRIRASENKSTGMAHRGGQCQQPIASLKRIDYTGINSTLWGIWVMPETPKGPKRPTKNVKAAQEAAKAIGKAKVAAKATKASTPANKPKPTPRRVFDQRIADIICIGLSEGMSLRQILKADTTGVLPAQSTVYEWLLRQPSFAEQYARAREEQADTNADEILEIADERPPEFKDDKGRIYLDQTYIAWQKNRIEARKWTAMKLKPKKYGDRVALEGVEGGAAIKTEDATADKFLEIIRNMEMKKRAG